MGPLAAGAPIGARTPVVDRKPRLRPQRSIRPALVESSRASPVHLGAHSGAVDQIVIAVGRGIAVLGVEHLGHRPIEQEADVVVRVLVDAGDVADLLAAIDPLVVQVDVIGARGQLPGARTAVLQGLLDLDALEHPAVRVVGPVLAGQEVAGAEIAAPQVVGVILAVLALQERVRELAL
jgi:hypothetical protein